MVHDHNTNHDLRDQLYPSSEVKAKTDVPSGRTNTAEGFPSPHRNVSSAVIELNSLSTTRPAEQRVSPDLLFRGVGHSRLIGVEALTGVVLG